MRIPACIAALATCVSLAAAQTAEPRRNAGPPAARSVSTAQSLRARVPEITFTDVPLEQVMEWVTEQFEINVAIRWQALEEVGVERDKPISLRARNLRLSQILWLIMNEAGGPDVKLAYRLSDGLFLLSTHENLSRDMIVRVYDLNDLLLRAPRFRNAGRIDSAQALNSSGQSSATGIFETDVERNQSSDDAVVESGRRMRYLISVIVLSIEPDSWKVSNAGGQGTIMSIDGRIIVRNSAYVHALLGGASSP